MSGIAFSTALIMPSMIFGIASTIAIMISGKAVTSEVRSWMPVSMICGMESSKKVMMPLMISGRAAINTGIASRSPCASPVISCKAASRSIGRLSTSPCTMVTIACTAAGMSVGSASAMPVTSVDTS